MSAEPEKSDNIKKSDDENQDESFQCLTPASTLRLEKKIEGEKKGQSSTSTVLQDQNPQSRRKKESE